MRFHLSTRNYRYQFISILLSLGVSSNCIPLIAYPAGLKSLPAEGLASHSPKEAGSDSRVPAGKEKPETESKLATPTSEGRVDQNFGKLPLRFEANNGQTDRSVRFRSRGNGYSLFLTSRELVLRLKKSEGNVDDKHSSPTQQQKRLISSLRLKLQNASSNPKIVGLDELPGKNNYFIGNNPKKWRTDVSQFAKVKYEQVYPGIDMVFYGTNQLEYDFVVAPRADANLIRLKFEGPQKQYIDDRGDLVLTIDGGEVRSHKPMVYQEREGQRQEIEGRYVLTSKNEVAFELGGYDHSQHLIIDPVLMYSTFLGASEVDYGDDIAVDADGNTYITGETLSYDFPILNAFQPILAGSTSGSSYSTDVFVTKFNAEGTQILYSTFLGGHDGADRGKAIAVDASGSAYITGDAYSPNFPTNNPFLSTAAGAFITKLSPSGNTLIYSSNLRANNAFGIAVDASGIAYVVGYSGSFNYQPINAIQQTFAGGASDMVIAKVSSSGSSLLYYSFLGGDGRDEAVDIALDNDGNMYVTGFTTSTNLPVTNAFQSSFAGTGTCGLSPNLHPCTDAFVVKLNAAGNSLLYFTYLGGSSDDRGLDVQVDSSGHAFVAGWTSSTNFPITAGAFQTTFGGENAASGYFGDAFVTKLDVAGNALVYSTYLGGNSEDQAQGLAIDSTGNAYVTGATRSPNFPNVNSLWATSGASSDAFVTKLNSLGNGLTYSTRLGGATWDEGNGIAVDAFDTAYVIGTASSSDFPILSAYQSTFVNFYEVFVAKILSGDGYTISGRITDSGGNSVNAVTMTLNGSRTLTTQTDVNGFYAFTYLRPGESGTITPSKNLFIFNPVNLTFSNLADNQTADFIATTSGTTYTIGGRVTNSGGIGTSGITMTLGGSLSNVTQTDANGNYSFTQLVGSGNYTVSPSQAGYNLTYTFTPPSRSYANLSANQVADFSFITSSALSVNAIADAYVQDGTLANTNFGNITPLLVKSDNQAGQRRDIYFKYDLSAVNRTITNAKLRIYAGLSASGSINTSAYSVSDILWSEGGITWNNKPARGSTALAGATVAVTSTTYASYDIDITSYVVGEKAAGRDIFSVALHNPSNSTPYILLNSREASTNKPQLVITTSGSNNSPPTISLTTPANGATYPAPANITATATANDIDGTVSKVDFYAGTSLIGTDATAPYSVQWSSVNAGAYAITAIATDNSGSSTASSAANVSVNLPNNLPVVSITAPVGGLTVPAGLSLSLSANATDIDGSITKVDFYAGASLLGTDTTAPYSVTWPAIAGAQTLTAVATDNAGATAPSAPVNISVVWQTGVTAVFDAYVRDGSSASTNFGTATELQTQQATGSNRESYLRFDLTNVNAVAKAKLRVYGKLSDASGSNVPVGVYSVASTNWIESGSGSITWNNKPPTGASVLSTTTVTDTVSRWYEFDVTSWVQPERDAGHTLISLALKSLASSGPYASFVSREPTNNRPQLLLWTRQQRLALLVVGSANLNAGDNAAKIRLENLGFTVTVKVANNNLVTGDADGKAVVVISSTVNDGSVNTKFRYVAVPVVSWESAVLDDLAMTAATSGNFGATTVAQTNVNIVSPTHPMAAGLSGSVPVTSPGTNFSWGIPNVTAVTIAALIGEPTKFVIFGYESGATMFSLDAPARRVALFMTDVTAGNFGTTNGGPLFDAAIRWATEVVTAPTITTLTPISGPISTVVSINGFNFGNTQSTSTLTFNGVAATPTSWTDKNIVASVPAFSTTGAVIVTVNGLASNGLTFSVGDVDSDADGLADWWELQYFGNLSQSANSDPDNDGLTNLQEYQQGRNPTKTSQADDGTGVDLRVHTPFMPPNL